MSDFMIKRREAASHDGFRLHQNPDGSWVFLEGVPFARKILGKGDVRKINECARKRGIKSCSY